MKIVERNVGDIAWASILFVVLLSLTISSPVAADEPILPPPVPIVPPLIISELTWAGSSVSTSDEWVELFNRTDAVIDLAGYSLWDAATATPKLMVPIASGQIGKHGYFLISNNSADHVFSAGQSVLDVTPDVINADVSLSNTNLKLQLRDATGAVVDTVGNGGAGFLRDSVTPRSMVRTLLPLGDGTLKASWSLATTKSGMDATVPDFGSPSSSGRPVITVPTTCHLLKTKDGEQPVHGILVSDPGGLADIVSITASVGSEALPTEQVLGSTAIELLVRATDALTAGLLTVTITATDQSGLTATAQLPCGRVNAVGDIQINEVMGSPEEHGQEFVELSNVGTADVELYGWTIDDIDTGGSTPYIISYPLHLAAGQLVALANTETKLAFNNSGDDVQLRSPTGERVDLVRYLGDLTGQSWNRGSPWYWSHPSPGRINDGAPPIDSAAQGGSTDSVLLTQHLSLHQILQSLTTLAGQTVETEATVAVSQGPYNARRLIVGDGQEFIELQLREDVNFPASVGTRLHLTATVSTSATPRLLLEKVEDATTIGIAARPIGALLAPSVQRLAQLISAEGTVEVAGVAPTLTVNGQTLKLSRRSGLKLPSMKVGDTVHFLGVVTAKDPLQVRVLEETDVTVEAAQKPVNTSPVVAAVATASVEATTDHASPPAEVAPKPDPIAEAQTMLSQLPLMTLTAGIQATTALLARRQVVIGTISIQVAAATAVRQPKLFPASLLILMLLSGFAVLTLGSDLLWQQLRRRVNGP